MTDIITIDLVVIQFIHFDFKCGDFFLCIFLRIRIFISFSVNVKLLLMIFVMFTSCFLSSSSNTSLLIFIIFSRSIETFGLVAILKEFECCFDHMIADMLNNKKRNLVVTKLFVGGKKLNISRFY